MKRSGFDFRNPDRTFRYSKSTLPHAPSLGFFARPFFALHDRDQARALLQAAEPSDDGYCQTHPRLIDSANPQQSLIVQKLVAGHDVCGSPMPITGGPHLLARSEIQCFVRWIEETAGEERREAPPGANSR
jgi:hypothetical protein